MAISRRKVYVCPVCHCVSARRKRHHNRVMVACDTGAPGDENSQPVFDMHGHLLTRAPKWWVDKCAECHQIEVARARKLTNRLRHNG